MSRRIIVLGDTTSHGGIVITADFARCINGKGMARVGDMTVCPRCKGVFPINSGAGDMVDGAGNGYAREMDTTACGAHLISSQATTTWSDESSMGDPAAGEKAAALAAVSQIAAGTSSGVCLDCLLKAAATGSATVVRE